MSAPLRTKPKRVLAIASGGGHWVQLLRLRPAFEDQRVTYVTVRDSYRTDVPGKPFLCVNDATRWDRVALVKMGLKLLWIMLRVRPQVVISTGAAPGYFAIRLGRLLGARTIWIDSIANVEHMSMTGMLVRKHADLWLTQWPHLAEKNGPTYSGAVL
jgi:UDP-N-acetylglucosamine:LPS N-acetylglucosamine transferase